MTHHGTIGLHATLAFWDRPDVRPAVGVASSRDLIPIARVHSDATETTIGTTASTLDHRR
jgi:hypothetical protein